MSQALIAALQNPALYSHPVDGFRVIETHISWVILTGAYAYKMKKPVDFGFLNFTELASRKHFCEQELLLNQRMAPELYLQVLPITGTLDAPIIGGEGEPIEYLVQMREFPQTQLMAEVQARGELTDAHIDALAEKIAQFHQSIPPVEANHPLNSAEAIVAPMRQNFEQIRPLLTEAADLQQLDALIDWTETSIERLYPLLEQRSQQGYIRECHGDLHLGNAAIINNKVVLFDCIEFNDPFRFIDIASDAAFLAMDLEDRGLKCQARRFLNGWLERTGDYAALELINLYKAYRALVRAKVSLFRLYQEQDAVERKVVVRQYRSYANLAESYSAIPSRFLAVTHGVSASGKSHVALRLVEALGMLRLRSDVERKRLHGEQPEQSNGLGAGIYSAEAGEATYQRLHTLAEAALNAGFSVVIDATYLKQEQRQAAWQVAEATGVPFLIIDCEAADAVIEQWLAQRQAEGSDPSDATMEVVKAQQASREPLSESERLLSRRLDTADASSLDSLLAAIRQRLPGL
ncbi:bifunctional aminoglycoside phosphotransferase/ATP-binding protein [Pseudomonas saudiphocaensis]|uniref:bifunctional aminoglycoside phosphotransferase/ATP-binding protein n=1 Tax=Pseudomonas saudiphocaensis TaxID=1499686 RepID=UPI00187D0D9A|nr:bifunctional aminoglycoside phosphotransferase/ATP-binding protein [Pseudomonas saudiphocaensis]MBE7929003.1 AAA family ATPase [Pseudomonas saudiphocaensis]